VLVSLDLSAAFDCISHSKLLSRLTNDFGVDGIVHSWLSSYLSDKSHYVKVCSGVSDTVEVR
jgi:hypothetical protein